MAKTKFESPPQQSKGILDDYAVRKNIASREGTVEKVPVNDSDIVNKKYMDENAGIWELNVGDEAQLKTAKDIQLQGKDIVSSGGLTLYPEGTGDVGYTFGNIEGSMVLGVTSGNIIVGNNLTPNFTPSTLGIDGAGWSIIYLRNRVDLHDAEKGAGVNSVVLLSDKSGGGSETNGPFPSGLVKFNGDEFYNMWGASAAFTLFGGGVDADNYRRFRILADGKMLWGTGAAATDMSFERGGTTWAKFESDINDDWGIGINNDNAGAGANASLRLMNEGSTKWSIGNDAGNSDALTIAPAFRLAGNEKWVMDATGLLHHNANVEFEGNIAYFGSGNETSFQHAGGGMNITSSEVQSYAAPGYVFTDSTGADPMIRWQQNHNGNLGISLRTVHNSASPAAFDIIWKHDIRGKDDESVEISYGFIQTSITDPDGDAPTAEHHIQFNEVTIGDGTNDTVFASNGDLSFAGTAGFYPRRIRQAAIPTAGAGATQIDTGEMLIWEDSDDDSVHLVYNDTTAGIKSIALS